MSGYQRFVAYVYEYHKGKKGENCGFIKAEVRSMRCRLQLQLQCAGLTPNVRGSVYGIVRRAGLMDGILLGNFQTGETITRCLMETDASDMNHSGFSFGQMGGIILKTENGAFFGTEWDDQPIRPENFRELTPTQEPGILKKKTGQQELPKEAEESIEAEKPETPEEERQSGEEEGEPGEEENPEKEESLREKENPEEEESPREEENPEEESPREEENPEEESPREEEAPKEEQNPKMPEEPEKVLHTQEIQKAEAPVSQQPVQPMFDPFGDGELIRGIQIQLRDFNRLNRIDWGLRNNRFLLYGFYNFGHLLLGQKADGSWILGIPGGYDQQEQFMANMFGFPYFKESRKIQLQRGKGGYWYRSIHTPNFHR